MTVPFSSRRGDTLASIAREYRLSLSHLEELNPNLEGRAPLPPGAPVILPLRRPVTSARIERAGPLVAYVTSVIAVSWKGVGLLSPVVSVHDLDRDRRVRLDIGVRRTLRVGDGAVEEAVFLAGLQDEPFGSLPVHARVGEGDHLLLQAGGPAQAPLPPWDQIREEVESRGGLLLRRLSERGKGHGLALDLSLTVPLSEILDRLPCATAVRLWAFCGDGFGCDSDRSDALGILRLLVERPALEADREPVRSFLERDRKGSGFEIVRQEEIRRESPGRETGQECGGVLSCPPERRLRLTEERTGTLKSCFRDGDFVLEFSKDPLPIAEEVFDVEVYFREVDPDGRTYRVAPDPKEVPAEIFDHEKRRLDLDSHRLVLLLRLTPDGLRLAEVWMDGEILPIDPLQ